MTDRRIVHDPLHGSISIDGFFLDILDRHEMQRLHSIKQLGLGNMVFPGANHTRFEHSMGVYHLAGRMAHALDMSKEDTDTVRAAAFLHDICHPPFSHTMEEILENETQKDHMDLARDLILGKIQTYQDRDEDIFGGVEPIGKLLEDNGISPQEVCDYIAYPESNKGSVDILAMEGNQSFFNSKDYIHQIIHGPVDADQMDYLIRDAHYTGVTHGAIDMDRLLSQMTVHNGKMVLDKGGIVAAEGLMVSRALMYSSVYYHKTVRIVEMMLTKAVESAKIDAGMSFDNLYLMNDGELISKLISAGGKASELTRQVLYRRLYKKTYTLYSTNMDIDDRAKLVKYTGYNARKRLEDEIASIANVDNTDVIVDIPSKTTLLSNIKIGKTGVLINDDGKTRPITKFSTLAKSLQSRESFDWVIMVSAPADKADVVRKATRGILSIDDTKKD